MAAIAKEAGVSRQTVYRYYRDIEAVLLAIAEVVAAHDDDFERLVAEQPDPSSQLDLVARTITGSGHAEPSATTLKGVLPPEGRDVLAQHEARIRRLVGDVLRRGIDDGSFRSDLDPEADPPLILGLLTASDPDRPERSLALVRQLVQKPTEEPKT